MSKSTKTQLGRFSTTTRKKTGGLSFVQLAQKHVTKVGTKEAKTVSHDVDNILCSRQK